MALPSYFPYSNNKKNYHFDLTGAFSNIIEESEAIEYDDDDDEDYDDPDDEKLYETDDPDDTGRKTGAAEGDIFSMSAGVIQNFLRFTIWFFRAATASAPAIMCM